MSDEITLCVTRNGKPAERVVVPIGRALIGSAAHCDLRLSPDEAAPEQMVLACDGDGVRVHYVAPSPVVTHRGAPIMPSRFVVPCSFELGATSVVVERPAIEASAPRRFDPALAAKLVVLGVLCAAVAFASTLHVETAGPPTAELPDVFAGADVACPHVDPTRALAEAVERRAVADAARERSPFEPREVRPAVAAYRVAGACFDRAGAETEARRAASAAAELEADARLELRARRIRLERMLAARDFDVARDDVTYLRAVLSGKGGPYVAWLSQVELELRNEKNE